MSAANTLLTFLNTGNPTGLKFVVSYGDSRCLFDFGTEHAPGRAPFSLGLRPRPGRELADLVAVGAAPPLEGVYAGSRWDSQTHIFLSHMHLDHTGLIPYLGASVPLYFPFAMEPVRAAADSSGYLAWRRPVGTAVADGSSVTVGPIQVRFVAVDHDVPGATGFIITTPDAVIAFTGDNRWHGLHPEVTGLFASAARGADVLIQEAVSLGWSIVPDASPDLSEAEAIAELGRIVSETPGLVIVNCYGMNRERVSGLAAACSVAGRKLLMEPQMGAMAGWPDFIGSDREPVRENPSGYCLQLGFESLPLLIDLRPPAGSVWVQCGGTPMGAFDPALAVLEAWIARFGLGLLTVNCSGHSRPSDIERMVRTVHPRRVLPVHSRAPEALVVPDVPSFIPRAGVAYSVSSILSGSSNS